MTVLVFGRTGQVGGELARRPGVTALGREDADLADPRQCAEAIVRSDADAVVNAAAYTAVDRAEEDEELARLVNAEAPAAMAEAAAARAIPFVHISTDYVFDGSGTRAWTPEDETCPLGAYGRTKLAGEAAVRAAGGPHAILRTSWVFSAHGNNFVKTILRLKAEKGTLAIVGDQIGGPTPAASIADACLALVEALRADPGKSGTYHFSGSPDVSWAEFASAIVADAGRGTTISAITSADYPTPAARPRNSRLDCSTLEAAFGIARPRWQDGLRRVLTELAGSIRD